MLCYGFVLPFSQQFMPVSQAGAGSMPGVGPRHYHDYLCPNTRPPGPFFPGKVFYNLFFSFLLRYDITSCNLSFCFDQLFH